MNERQKKKLMKRNLIKIKKLHPKQGDIICLIPDLDEIDSSVIVDFFDVYEQKKFLEKYQ